MQHSEGTNSGHTEMPLKGISMKIRLGLLTLILISVVVCFCGCKAKKPPTKSDSNAPEPNIAQSGKPVKEVIATVNGIDILKSDFEASVEQQIGKVQRQMPQNFFEQYKRELGKKILDEMIVDVILAQKARQQGIVVTEQEISERVNEILQRQKMSMQDFRELLVAEGLQSGPTG